MSKKLLSLVIVLALVLTGAALAEGAAVTVTDDLGRAVEIASVPEKVVSLTSANTEILYALGVQDKLVGVDSYSDYPAEATALDIVGDYTGPNIELIASLAPDVVFASSKLQQETVAQLEALGLKVVCVEPTTYEEIYKGIGTIAQVMGVDAATLISSMREKEAEVVGNTPKIETPVKVYFALSFGEYGDWTAGPGTFIDEMITMAGGVNVAGSAEVSWPSYSLEQLILDDPDVIMVSAYDDTVVEQLTAAEGYKELRAVKEGNVFAVDANTTSRPGPRIVEALVQIADALSKTAAEDAA